MPTERAPWWDLRPAVDEQDRKIQFIWKQIIDPCDAPITLWIWLMWHPLWKLVLQWFAIDLTQVFTAYLRPGFRATSVRSRRHWGGGKRGKRPSKKGGRFNPITFDPNEYIGGEILGFDQLGGFRPLPGELTFWTIEGVAERAAFYWMLLDLTTDFLYEWSSAVAKTKYCHARDDAVLLATAPGYPLLGIFGWDAMGILEPVKMRHILFFNGYGVTAPWGPAAIHAAADGHAAEDSVQDPWMEIRLRCLGGIREGLTVENRIDTTPGADVELGVQGTAWGGETWIAEIRVNGRWDIIGPTLALHAVADNPP